MAIFKESEFQNRPANYPFIHKDNFTKQEKQK